MSIIDTMKYKVLLTAFKSKLRKLRNPEKRIKIDTLVSAVINTIIDCSERLQNEDIKEIIENKENPDINKLLSLFTQDERDRIITLAKEIIK